MELRFKIEEFHRGEWQPFMIRNEKGEKVQKTCKITQEQADRLNVYQDDYRLRYLIDNNEASNTDLIALRAEYEAAVGKKPYGGWDADKIREKMAEKLEKKNQ